MLQQCLSSLKAAAKRLKNELTALYYASSDPAVGCLPRLIIGAALAYALSPIDLIPDFIPVLGLLDDLLLLPCLLALAVRLIPADVLARARARAELEPLRLSQNLPAACFIALIWLCTLVWAASLAVPLVVPGVRHRPAAVYGLAALAVGAGGLLVALVALCCSARARSAARRCLSRCRCCHDGAAAPDGGAAGSGAGMGLGGCKASLQAPLLPGPGASSN